MELQLKQPFWVSRAATAKCYYPLPLFQQGDVCDWDTILWLQQMSTAERSSSRIYYGKSTSQFVRHTPFQSSEGSKGIFLILLAQTFAESYPEFHHFHSRSFSIWWKSRRGFFSGGRGSCVGWCQQNLSVIPQHQTSSLYSRIVEDYIQ